MSRSPAGAWRPAAHAGAPPRPPALTAARPPRRPRSSDPPAGCIDGPRGQPALAPGDDTRRDPFRDPHHDARRQRKRRLRELHDDRPHRRPIGPGRVQHVRGPDDRLARLDPGPLVAHAHPAAALDHDEVRPAGVRVRRDAGVPAERQLRDEAGCLAADDLALDAPRPGRPVRPTVPDPEPPDLDRHGLPPWTATVSGAGGAGATTSCGWSSRDARSARARSSAAWPAGARTPGSTAGTGRTGSRRASPCRSRSWRGR